jgi:glycosyltransferase involved in cell wall biosynthesis
MRGFTTLLRNSLRNSSMKETRILLAYVGAVVPEHLVPDQVAFSRAGNMSQENLLIGLKSAGLFPSMILSQCPMRSFPKSKTIWFPGNRVTLANGLPAILVPFLNLPILRPATVGLAVLGNILLWGLRYHSLTKIVYTYNLTEPPGLFTLLSARLVGAKAVVSLYDINVPGETVPASFARRADFWLQRKLIPHFDGIVVISTRIVQDFAPRSKFVRIEGGVTEQILHQANGGFNGHSTPRPFFTVVSAGSLKEANGIIELLEAFSLLPNKNLRLRIAGKGPLENLVRKAAQSDPRIEYCGYLTFAQVLQLYASADVLINMRLTRRVRTDYFFPSKMMEYLASGVPVITTCTGHVEEEYADFVFLLKDESPQGLARLIEDVMSLDPALRMEKGRKARAYIQAHGTWEAQGRRVVEFIRSEVLGRPVKNE